MPRKIVEDSNDDLPELASLLKSWAENSAKGHGRSVEQHKDSSARTTRRTTARSRLVESNSSKNRNSASGDRGVKADEIGSNVQTENLPKETKKVKKRVLNARSAVNPLLRPIKSTDDSTEGRGRRRGVKNGSRSNREEIEEANSESDPNVVEQIGEDNQEILPTSGDPNHDRKVQKALFRLKKVTVKEILDSELEAEPAVPRARRANASATRVSLDDDVSTGGVAVPTSVSEDTSKLVGNVEGRCTSPQPAKFNPPSKTTGRRQIPPKRATLKSQYATLDSEPAVSGMCRPATPEKDDSHDAVDPVTARRMREDNMKRMVARKRAEDPTRYRPHTPSDRSDTDMECSKIEYDQSESDDMSDFIVNDSHISDGESSSQASSPPLPPRSTRKLQRGRRSRESYTKYESDHAPREAGGASRARGILFEEEKESVRITDNDAFFSSSDGVSNPTPQPTKPNRRRGQDLSIDLAGLSIKDEAAEEKTKKMVPTHPKTTTPPQSPLLKPIKLKSPTKRFPTVPTSPHRPTMDLFWDQNAMNEWNDEYSPQKALRPLKLDDSPIKGGFPLFSPSKPRSPTKTAKSKKAFEQAKHELAESFLAELDVALCQGQVAKLSESTGGVKLIWSKKLNTTAGRANWKRETIKSSLTTQPSGMAITYRHHASIELAEKVIDDEHRLLNVLAHEFCHLTTFMISNVKTNPHGKEFKSWAAKCTRLFSDRDIEVTTKHSYEIEYKYIWECENCGLEYRRHSKSIDPVKHRCGSCKATLTQTKPVLRGGKEPGTLKKVTEYQTFVKENMKLVREENPGSPQKDVMGLVAKKYKEHKASKLVLTEVDGGNARRSKESTPDVSEMGNLVRKLDFLDLTKI